MSARKPKVVFSGWLEKQGAGNKAFRRRYFELQTVGMLNYFKKQTDSGKPAGTVDLTVASEVQPINRDSETDSWIFTIKQQDRTWVFRSMDKDNAEQWHQQLTDFIAMRERTRGLSVNSAAAVEANSGANPIQLEPLSESNNNKSSNPESRKPFVENYTEPSPNRKGNDYNPHGKGFLNKHLFGVARGFRVTYQRKPSPIRAVKQFFWSTIFATLRGFGQVLMCNNPVTGLLILIAILVDDSWRGLLVALSALAAHLTTKPLHIDPKLVRSGALSASAVLTGCFVASFLDTTSSNHVFNVLTALFGGVVSCVLHLALRNAFRSRNLPIVTLPAVLASLAFVTGALSFHHAPTIAQNLNTEVNAALSSSAVRSLSELSVGPFFEGLVRAPAQLFLSSELTSGILIAAGVFLSSRIAFLLLVVGALSGSLTGMALGAPIVWIEAGTLAFNGALTAIALGSVHFVFSTGSVLLAVFGSILAVVLQLGLTFSLSSNNVDLWLHQSLAACLAIWIVCQLGPYLRPSCSRVHVDDVVHAEVNLRRFKHEQPPKVQTTAKPKESQQPKPKQGEQEDELEMVRIDM